MKIIFLILMTFISIGVNASNFVSLKIPQSKIIAETPNITVALPSSYKSDIAKAYPVLFVLDGELNGELVNGMLHRLHLSNGSNEHIIVGVTSSNRLRDFAPTVNKDPRGPVGEGGGGDKFLDFLESELIPHINKQYRTTKFNVIAGHSIAGLFVIHTFHSRPKLFQAHLAFSPAVWWGARETVTSAQNYIVSSESVGSYLYMNIGSENGELRNVYDSFAKMIMRNRSTELDLRLNQFDAVGHDFTMAAGLYNALSGLHTYQRRKGI
ncbi:putative alpha/beta superfamily hydrolase [Rheinheimera pacifica]|uniref:alpha/beta hydrolase n=1 Tax=Rheinheimera pacifica TaxID=173990 RepID=UPI00285F6C19|nr:alpha/beta hydrolase-fold protein [Rheinheimera pacifica]MDR6982557.1 putative alpha/beta superfamily hydrolase [Rheinheimera pacifica]